MLTADPMIERGKIVHNSPLFRLQQETAANPVDQEQAEFYSGDVADVCNAFDCKAATALKKKISGRKAGERIMLPLAEVRQLIDSILQKTPEEVPADAAG